MKKKKLQRHSEAKAKLVGHDIIVVGASAGGVGALRELVSKLPAALPAALFIVLHLPSDATSLLPEILSAAGPLRVFHALDRGRFEHGCAYVAPPGYHLLIERQCMRVLRGPRENGHRPAADPLFRSAALAFGHRVIGVVLTGNLDDGTSGLLAVKSRGGVTVIQDPKDAVFPGMPSSAAQHVAVDYSVPISDMGPLLAKLVHMPVAETPQPPSESMRLETKLAKIACSDDVTQKIGKPSLFTCPDCQGTLFEIREKGFVRFRCRTGHAYGGESLFSAQIDGLEESLWAALRGLEEQADLSIRLAAGARERNQKISAARFKERHDEAVRHAETLRKVLLSRAKPKPGSDRPDFQMETHGKKTHNGS